MVAKAPEKRRILMIAYACNPEGAGEHWLGWEWAAQAAKRYQVTLLTTPNARDEIVRHAPQHGIEPHFIAVPGMVRKITSLLGQTAGWWRKLAWQKEVLRVARQLHQKTPFGLVHQTTFHTFRIPFMASRLPIPSLWGPIAGGESVPPGFDHFLGPDRFSEKVRSIVNRGNLLIPSVRSTLRETTMLWVSNGITLDFLPAECQRKAIIVPANAPRPEDGNLNSFSAEERPLTLLYVGNCVARRALPLVFEALSRVSVPWRLEIVGGGPALPYWKAEATRLGVFDRVAFVGTVRREELDGYYSRAHALVFPALRDSGGSALLEAMTKGLPVICLDWGGPGEMLDDASGIKIPVDDVKETVAKFAEAVERIAREPEWARGLASKAALRAESRFGWDAKRRILEESYQRLLAS